MYWILHLKHESHRTSEEAYLLVPDDVSYSALYLMIPNLQKIHSEGDYLTEDLSGRQVAFALSEMYGIEKIPTADAEDQITNGMFFRPLDLFWNWERIVVRLCFDEASRAAGEPPHFFPYLNDNAYPKSLIRNILAKMDDASSISARLTTSPGLLVNLPSSRI